ncbi:MAG: hypothetical protein SFY95_05060 [Planctomycetota bacterium]|nr:hypothetical protein [Planctomycetota bacterium]
MIDRRAWSVLGLMVLAGSAWAQSEATPPTQPPATPAVNSSAAGGAQAGARDEALPPYRAEDGTDRWRLQIEPSIWYASPGGKLKLPGASGAPEKVDLKDINLDSPRVSPLGRIHIYRDDFRISISGMSYSSDRNFIAAKAGQQGNVTYNAGDLMQASYDFATADLTGAWRFLNEIALPNRDGSIPIGATLDVALGARIFDLSARVSRVGGASTGVDEFFAQPVAGLRFSIGLLEHFTIDVTSNVGYMSGGDRSSSSWDIVAAFTWNATENLGLQVGYRNLSYNLKAGPKGVGRFESSGSMAGLLFGLSLRF